MVQQYWRLGCEHDLRLDRHLLDQRREDRNRGRVQAELGLARRIKDGRRECGLKQYGRQSGEPKRTVGKGRRSEVRVRRPVSPFETKRLFVERQRLQMEIVEKGRNELDGPPDQIVGIGVLAG